MADSDKADPIGSLLERKSVAATRRGRMSRERLPCAKLRTNDVSALRPVLFAMWLVGLVAIKPRRWRDIKSAPAAEVRFSS